MSNQFENSDTPSPLATRWEQRVSAPSSGRWSRLLRGQALVWETQLALMVWLLAAWFAYRTLTSSAPVDPSSADERRVERVDAAGF